MGGSIGRTVDLSAAARADEFARAHAAMLKDGRLQFKLTEFTTPDPPRWLDWLAKALEGAAPVLNIVFWSGVAVGVLLVCFFIVREVLAARRDPDNSNRLRLGDEGWRPDLKKARVLLADADRLAAEGRFAEAAHLLLLKGVDDVGERRPGELKPALTSREIAALPQLPAQARSAFGTIAAVVERSLFGGRDVDQAAWTDCRQSYEALVFAETWR